jgi:hypothetical protein
MKHRLHKSNATAPRGIGKLLRQVGLVLIVVLGVAVMAFGLALGLAIGMGIL